MSHRKRLLLQCDDHLPRQGDVQVTLTMSQDSVDKVGYEKAAYTVVGLVALTFSVTLLCIVLPSMSAGSMFNVSIKSSVSALLPSCKDQCR